MKIINLWKKIIEKLYCNISNNLAYTDELTGCYNRNFFEREIEKITKQKHCYICVCDINKLKNVNNKQGHNAGDKLIKKVATELSKYSKKTIRYGGDEFILIFFNETERNIFLDQAINQDDYCFGIEEKNKNDSAKSVFEIADKKMIRQKKIWHCKKGDKNKY